MILQLRDQLVPPSLPLVQVHQPFAVLFHQPPLATAGRLTLLQQTNRFIHPPILKRLPDAQLTDIGIVCVAHQKGVQFLLWQGQLFHKVEAAHQQLFHLIFTGITLLAGSLKVCDLSIYQLPILEQQGSIELFSRYSPSQHR